jgi:hypothetical protein
MVEPALRQTRWHEHDSKNLSAPSGRAYELQPWTAIFAARLRIPQKEGTNWERPA